MLHVLALAALLPYAPTAALPTAAPAPADGSSIAAASAPGDKRAIKVIKTWLQMYRRGDFDLSPGGARAGRGQRGQGQRGRGQRGQGQGGRGQGGRGNSDRRDETDKMLISKHKLVPPDFRGRLTHAVEIDLLCRQARETQTVEAARAILEVAAVGLDHKIKYTGKMAPSSVRRTGETHLRRCRGKDVVAFLVKAANGTPGGSPRLKSALQAAALRALGARQSSDHRQVMVSQLDANHPSVRTAAAHALGRLGETTAIEPLARRLGREGDGTTIIEILAAIESIHGGKSEHEVKLAHMQMAVLEAGRALGRGDTWRPDMAIVDFLAKFRSKTSIPILIALLERYLTDQRGVKSGRLSGRLRSRTHEVLTLLTGARIAMTSPDKWKEFWETNKDSFQLAKNPKRSTRGDATTGAFFNIPVQGKRVVFVIDISGSMNQPMRVRGGATVAGGGGGGGTRGPLKIAVAKRELWGAVQALPADTKFNVIWYNAGIGQWSKDLVTADEGAKGRFKSWLDRLRANGATNIYDAMKLALKIKSLVYGEHYDSNVDEVFLLSDGMPNTGEITDPNEILRVITETNKFSRVRINTVYLEDGRMGGFPGRGGPGGRGGFPGGFPGGGRGGMSGAGLMQQLAEKNGGKFVQP